MLGDEAWNPSEDDKAVEIDRVEIVADCVVRITLTVTLTGQGVVRYAARESSYGVGMLCDSDSAVGDLLYEYSAGNGQSEEHNVAHLVDAPYPLTNWCVAFNRPVQPVQVEFGSR